MKFWLALPSWFRKLSIIIFHNYFSTNSQNMKKLWSGIKTIIFHKSSTSSSINKIKGKDGNVTSDPSKMSNIFNDFYVNVADGITKTIPLTPKSPLDYLSDRICSSLFLTPVTSIEVNDLIRGAFHSKKSRTPVAKILLFARKIHQKSVKILFF